MESTILHNVTPDQLAEMIGSAVNEKLNSLPTQEQKPKKGKYLTRIECSEKLRISLPTLHKMTKSGKLKGYRVGRRVVYHSDEVEESLVKIPSNTD